eukprot:1752135-Pleurochrysis_carterae.AAC.1
MRVLLRGSSQPFVYPRECHKRRFSHARTRPKCPKPSSPIPSFPTYQFALTCDQLLPTPSLPVPPVWLLIYSPSWQANRNPPPPCPFVKLAGAGAR